MFYCVFKFDVMHSNSLEPINTIPPNSQECLAGTRPALTRPVLFRFSDGTTGWRRHQEAPTARVAPSAGREEVLAALAVSRRAAALGLPGHAARRLPVGLAVVYSLS